MTIIFVVAVLISGGLVVLALARGLYHFSREHGAASESDAALHENHKMQNRMMIQRIKWQAIVVVLLVLAMLFAVGGQNG